MSSQSVIDGYSFGVAPIIETHCMDISDRNENGPGLCNVLDVGCDEISFHVLKGMMIECKFKFKLECLFFPVYLTSFHWSVHYT